MHIEKGTDTSRVRTVYGTVVRADGEQIVIQLDDGEQIIARFPEQAVDVTTLNREIGS